jgi:Flp pilus assembly protein TadB
MNVIVAVLVGACVGAGVLLAGASLTAAPAVSRRRGLARAVNGHRLALGAVAGLLTAMLSGWLLAGAAVAALCALWGHVFTSARASHERRRLEAIAKWLEDIRDLVRGSGLSLEQALEHTAASPPAALREELARFLQRCRQGWDLDDALVALADEFAHPTADAAIAAVLMAVGTSGARLATAVTTLAEVARDEVAARERSDRLRAVYESSMRRLIVIAIGIIGFLRVTSADLLAPLRSPAGQMWLVVPLAVWTGCLVWLRRLSRYDQPRRYRLRAATEVVR